MTNTTGRMFALLMATLVAAACSDSGASEESSMDGSSAQCQLEEEALVESLDSYKKCEVDEDCTWTWSYCLPVQQFCSGDVAINRSAVAEFDERASAWSPCSDRVCGSCARGRPEAACRAGRCVEGTQLPGLD